MSHVLCLFYLNMFVLLLTLIAVRRKDMLLKCTHTGFDFPKIQGLQYVGRTAVFMSLYATLVKLYFCQILSN